MNAKIDYNRIVIRLFSCYGEKLNDWETEFVDNMMSWTGDFTEAQKETIIKMSRKYIAKK